MPIHLQRLNNCLFFFFLVLVVLIVVLFVVVCMVDNSASDTEQHPTVDRERRQEWLQLVGSAAVGIFLFGITWLLLSYHEITPHHRAVYSKGGELTGRVEMPHRHGHFRDLGWGIPLLMPLRRFYMSETYQELLMIEDTDRTDCIQSKSFDAETVHFCYIEVRNKVEFNHEKRTKQLRRVLEKRFDLETQVRAKMVNPRNTSEMVTNYKYLSDRALRRVQILHEFDLKWSSFEWSSKYHDEETNKCALMLMKKWGIDYDKKLILSRVPKSIHEFCPSKKAKDLVVSEYHNLDEVISNDLTQQLEKEEVEHCIHINRVHIPPPTVREDLQKEWEKTNVETAKKSTKMEEAINSKIEKDKEARDALIVAEGKFEAARVDAMRMAHDTTSRAHAEHHAEKSRTNASAHAIETLSIARANAVLRESKAEAKSLMERIQVGFNGDAEKFNDYELTRAIWKSNNTKVLTYGPSIPKFVAIGGN